MQTTTPVVVVRVATKTEPTFRRGRHLALSVVGLVHAPLVKETGLFALWITGAQGWSAELAAVDAMIALCFTAFVAWFAFAVFDTHAGITIWPKRWRDIGAPLAAWCVVLELGSVIVLWRSPAIHRSPAVEWWFAAFEADPGGVIFWGALATLAHAAAEEIVYRLLLLRALEGYMSQTLALVIQAALFELVHAYVYGYGFLSGAWFIGGYFFGAAFLRTRSLAAPMLLHAAHNIIFFASVWYFNQ